MVSIQMRRPSKSPWSRFSGWHFLWSFLGLCGVFARNIWLWFVVTFWLRELARLEFIQFLFISSVTGHQIPSRTIRIWADSFSCIPKRRLCLSYHWTSNCSSMSFSVLRLPNSATDKTRGLSGIEAFRTEMEPRVRVSTSCSRKRFRFGVWISDVSLWFRSLRCQHPQQ